MELLFLCSPCLSLLWALFLLVIRLDIRRSHEFGHPPWEETSGLIDWLREWALTHFPKQRLVIEPSWQLNSAVAWTVFVYAYLQILPIHLPHTIRLVPHHCCSVDKELQQVAKLLRHSLKNTFSSFQCPPYLDFKPFSLPLPSPPFNVDCLSSQHFFVLLATLIRGGGGLQCER